MNNITEADVNVLLRLNSRSMLISYVVAQLNNFFPSDSKIADIQAIDQVLDQAILRLLPILRDVNAFNGRRFDHLNSLQYASFLYLLSNENWTQDGPIELSERLFLLNKALNNIDLFYSVSMPSVFFISHGIGTVLGNVVYGERLVIFQNVTVGRIGTSRPEIGHNVILYPGSTITGSTCIGNHCVIGAGVLLHNQIIPDNSIVKFVGGQYVVAPKSTKFNHIDFYLTPSRG
ncbi:MAG: serine O-acetyltransferase [Flavobacterium sp.]|jgi:serine O-acetyltransferase